MKGYTIKKVYVLGQLICNNEYTMFIGSSVDKCIEHLRSIGGATESQLEELKEKGEALEVTDDVRTKDVEFYIKECEIDKACMWFWD